jgi:hypothetical protein
MPSNPFKMSPANGALSRLYLFYSVPLSVWLRVWLGSWEIGPPTMEFVRLRFSHRPLIHFRRHLGNRTFKSELTAVIAVFVRNFANCSRVLMTKNSSARSRKSRSSMIWNDGFSVNQRQLSTNWRLTLTVAPYYCPSGSSSVNLAGICPPLFIATLALNVFAVFVLFPLADEPFHRFPE